MHATTDHRLLAMPTAPAAAVPLRVWVAAWLLSGAYIDLAWESVSGSLSLAAVAPLAAAWAVQRFGPRVIAPLAALALLPSINFAITSQLSMGVVPPPLSFMLLGIVGGALLAARRDPGPWRDLVHHSRAWLWVPALALVFLGHFEWPPYSPRGPEAHLYRTIDVVGTVAALLLVSVVDWQALAAHATGTGEAAKRALVRWALPGLLVAAASVSLGVHVDTLAVGWGSAWLFGSAPALCALLFLMDTTRWRRQIAIIVVIFAAEAVHLYAGSPPIGSLVREARYPGLPDLWSTGLDFASAIVAVFVIVSIVRTDPLPSPRQPAAEAPIWLALAVIVLLQLVIKPLNDTYAEFWGRGTIAWLVGLVAFASALLRGGRAVAAAPLALAAIAVASPMLAAGMEQPIRLLGSALGVAAVAAMYAFIGMTVLRSLESSADVQATRAAQLDVGRLAKFVSRLDTSATLRSFGVLLVVLGTGLALVQFGVMSVIVAWFERPDMVEVSELALAGLLVLLLLLLPLAFIGVDAMNRNDALRPLSAVTGAALAAIVVAAVVLLTALPVAAIVELYDMTWVAVVAVVIVAAVSAMSLITHSRRTVMASGIVWALLMAAGFVVVVIASVSEAPSSYESYAQPVVGLLAVAAALAMLVRGVLLRADLTAEIPRGLLFGEIEGGGLWARLACLMGMPASMWNRAALKMPAFWTLLIARPLVYVGALGVWRGSIVIGVIAIVAGHGLFALGKRLAARAIWKVGNAAGDPPVLFLRSFEDDQFDFGGRSRNPLRRWLDLWAFRRNLDETLVDEVARYGPVVALGRPGEKSAPFGAARYYATQDEWQRVITDAARRAHTIVIVAGATPGVRWEYDLLARERLIERTVLLFRPGPQSQAANRAALEAFPLDETERATLGDTDSAPLVALVHVEGKPVLLQASSMQPGAYVLVLRAHFQRRDVIALAQSARSAPPERSNLAALLTLA
jgi:hypothetical protein